MADSQLKINWKKHQRDAWIENAAIRDGVANDGSTVKADKIKSLLLKINSFLAYEVEAFCEESCGNEVEAWPSQDTLAKLMSVSTKTVSRATQAAQNMCLLIVQEKSLGRGTSVGNHYRPVWSELLLLDPDRKRAFLESIEGERSSSRSSRPESATERSDTKPQKRGERSDMVTERSDMVTERSDMVTERSDTMSHELTTNYPKKHSPPLQSDAKSEDPWKVVVSVLFDLGMVKASEAVTAAKGRELTVPQVDELIASWERLRARQSGVTIAWLYRWLMGLSRPPEEPEARQARRPSVSVANEASRRSFAVVRRFRELQKAKLPRDEIESIVNREFRIKQPPPQASDSEIEQRRLMWSNGET